MLFIGGAANSCASEYVIQSPADYSNRVSIHSFGFAPPFSGLVEDVYKFSILSISNVNVHLGYSEYYSQFPEFGYFQLSGAAGLIPLAIGNDNFSPTNQSVMGSFFELQPGDYNLLVHVQQLPTIDSAFNYELSMQAVSQPVPEPATNLIFLTGLGLMGAIGLRRKNKRSDQTA